MRMEEMAGELGRSIWVEKYKLVRDPINLTRYLDPNVLIQVSNPDTYNILQSKELLDDAVAVYRFDFRPIVDPEDWKMVVDYVRRWLVGISRLSGEYEESEGGVEVEFAVRIGIVCTLTDSEDGIWYETPVYGYLLEDTW